MSARLAARIAVCCKHQNRMRSMPNDQRDEFGVPGPAADRLRAWKAEADAALAAAEERLAKLEQARLLDERADRWRASGRSGVQ